MCAIKYMYLKYIPEEFQYTTYCCIQHPDQETERFQPQKTLSCLLPLKDDYYSDVDQQ